MSNQKNLPNLRHSLAHLLASAVLEMFPKAQLGVGPVIENGFYYDFLLPRPVGPEDLKKLEKRMRALAKERLVFEKKEMGTKEAKKFFKDLVQPFKVELIDDLEKFGTTRADEIFNADKTLAEPGKKIKGADTVTLYQTGKFVDLCRGGHVGDTSEIKTDAFQLDKVSGAYWRGDQNNPQMQRIYGLAFTNKNDLDEYLAKREEAKKRDHKILGTKLDLFVFSDLVGAGLPLFTPKGTILRDLLDSLVWELRRLRGYERVDIPHITKKDLYETSGHWSKFSNELFRITTRENHVFAMKPMNCPHHVQIYARKQWSYRDLPQRYASTTKVYRDEQTGELSGLARVRSITQDDAHVFCRISQAQNELQKIWEIVHIFYTACGLPLKLRLSLHDPKQPEKYLGDKNLWKQAEDILRKVAKANKTEYFEAPGEAAFYAPKLDFIATDSLGREWQVATIQLDIVMPERFDLSCINEGGKPERIVIIHAAIMGAIERFLAILIEHTAGAFPVWLAPVQISLVPVSDKFNGYAEKLAEKLRGRGLRVEVDIRSESVGKKIREAEMQKAPYMLVVGEKEKTSGELTVRHRGEKEQFTEGLDVFVKRLEKEIDQKK